MTKQLLSAILLIASYCASAQYDVLSVSQGYADAVFLDLSSRETSTITHDSWDIAFAVDGRGSGVFINEGVASSFSAPPPRVAAYVSTSTDFATADTSTIVRQVYNQEYNWSNGAFNTPADANNQLDLGWGSYDPATQTVQGTRIFFINLRDGSWRKVLIESLSSGAYTFKHALLDGSDEQTNTVSKSDFEGQTLAYFSFGESQAKSLEPASWDLLFTRYTTPLFDGQDSLEYTVTGVLQNKAVTVAEVYTATPETEPTPTDGFTGKPTTIGHDWKSFDFATSSFVVAADLAYFVQTPDSTYRLQFIDFGGSTNGEVVYGLWSLSGVSSARDLAPKTPAKLFPVPATNRATLSFSSELSHQARMAIFDLSGRLITAREINITSGENTLEVPASTLPNGSYIVTVQGGNTQVIERLLIQH